MIIVSITGPSAKEALDQIGRSRRHADLFEFRIDLMKRPDIAALVRFAGRPVIVACRSGREGGEFRGTERERAELLQLAAAMEIEYVDIEESSGEEFLNIFRNSRGGPGVVLSSHRPGKSGVQVGRLFRRMAARGCDVLKLARPVRDAAEIRFVIDFLALCRKERRKGIAVATGAAGESTRVLYRKFGGWATYASAYPGAEAAEGQITAEELRALYRAHQLTGSTKVFGVVGTPLGQSRGVYLHNPLFHRASADAVYCRFPVKQVRRFMNEVAPLLSGFSVTHPHKRKIIPYLASVDELAGQIGAVNTVIRGRRGFSGYNTDAPAALDAIENVVRVRSKRVLILGAGGAARAVAFEAVRRGARVVVASRKSARAKRVASEIGAEAVSLDCAGEVPYDVLVNATPVGMAPDDGKSPFSPESFEGKIVFDCVYNPPMTKLLRDAARGGAVVISGVEMYLKQAARQSTYYVGTKPSMQFMRKTLGYNAADGEHEDS